MARIRRAIPLVKLHNFLPLILRMTVNEVRKFKAVMGIYIKK